MGNIKKVMVAIGFSKYSEGILDYAAGLAEGLGAELLVANIINVRDVEAVSGIESMGYKVDTEEYIKGVEEERRVLLDKMMEKISFPSEKVKMVFKVGHPFERLMKIIKEEKSDIIVMGQKGRTDLEHLLTGSVAEKIFRHSPVPVLSIRTK